MLPHYSDVSKRTTAIKTMASMVMILLMMTTMRTLAKITAATALLKTMTKAMPTTMTPTTTTADDDGDTARNFVYNTTIPAADAVALLRGPPACHAAATCGSISAFTTSTVE